MANTMTLSARSTVSRSLVLVSGVVAAIALPWIFHTVGKISGLGTALGASFLPMHVGVFAAAILAGPLVGLAAGILSPLISFALTGMPLAGALPLMLVEVAAYGLSAGLLAKHTRLPVVGTLFAAQLAGRLLRAAVIFAAVKFFGSESLRIPMIWGASITGLPGILLQLALVPLLVYRLRPLFDRDAV